MENKILHLTLKRKWFDMIAAGIKKEEYRDIKPHWDARLIQSYIHSFGEGFSVEYRQYDQVSANNGYRKNGLNITWKHLGVRIGKPNPEWCEPEDVNKLVYILDIGELISYRNYEGLTSYGSEWIKIFNYSSPTDCK